jgi:hypothetical protein
VQCAWPTDMWTRPGTRQSYPQPWVKMPGSLGSSAGLVMTIRLGNGNSEIKPDQRWNALANLASNRVHTYLNRQYGITDDDNTSLPRDGG